MSRKVSSSTHPNLTSDSISTLIEVRPGEGGADAEAFAQELADSFAAWCRRQEVPFELSESGRTLVLAVPPTAASRLSAFAGVHRVQREPSKSAKRHTSTATVAVLSAAVGSDAFDEADVVWEAHRGGGKGGQHQNTTDSAVRARHLPTGITVDFSGRSQWQNRQAALAELRRRVNDLASARDAAVAHQHRSSQIGSVPGRAEKDFTHNYQRGEVICHGSGKRIQLARFQRGRF